MNSPKLIGKSTNKASSLVPPVCLSVCRGLEMHLKGIVGEIETF